MFAHDHAAVLFAAEFPCIPSTFAGRSFVCRLAPVATPETRTQAAETRPSPRRATNLRQRTDRSSSFHVVDDVAAQRYPLNASLAKRGRKRSLQSGVSCLQQEQQSLFLAQQLINTGTSACRNIHIVARAWRALRESVYRASSNLTRNQWLLNANACPTVTAAPAHRSRTVQLDITNECLSFVGKASSIVSKKSADGQGANSRWYR